MGNIAIHAEGLGKRYYIGGPQERYKTFRDALTNAVKAPFQRAGRLLRGQASGAADLNQEIWALQDVSFDIQHGDVVGIIGRNGAGKSTLLKILSRITEPTVGYADVYGRVGSLLEVGTGFHPELTGRENIYLNGAILGMSRAEINRKFDEIVDFAEVERFIDTPVKHYSSGMGLRLGFAVAAHLEPEILVVDEVLAVGDAAFQKKCLGKMSNVAGEGRTVLFVSHNMGAVENLCNRAIVLDNSTVVMDTAVDDGIKYYLSTVRSVSSAKSIGDRLDRQGTGVLRFTDVQIRTDSHTSTDIVSSGEDVEIVIAYEAQVDKPLKNVSVSVPFYNHMGQHMFMCWTRLIGEDYHNLPSQGEFVVRIPRMPLSQGGYHINLWCEVNGVLADWLTDVYQLSVVGGDFFGTGVSLPGGRTGVFIDHTWDFREHAEETIAESVSQQSSRH